MKEVLQELNEGSSVLLEIEKLDEFLAYCMKQKDFYSFRFEYSETLVQITLMPRDIIIKLG